MPVYPGAFLNSADEHAQTTRPEHGDRHSPPPRAETTQAARRVARCGRAAMRRQNPSSRRRGTEGLCLGAGSLHSGHLRGIGPEPGPGRTLIPGDGAAGDQRAQNRPGCPAMAATRLLRAVLSQRLPGATISGDLPSCNRQVTSISIHMARPGPASAPRGHAPL